MRNFAWPAIAISLFVLGWYHAGVTPVSAATTDEAQAVLRASRERFAAFNAGDRATWSRDTSESFQRIDDEGQISDTAANIPPVHHPFPDTAQWTSSPTVQFVEGVAIVTGRQAELEDYPGGKVIDTYERTEMWAKQAGRWVQIRSQVTPLLINYMRPISPPKNLEQYAGTYQWAPGLLEHLAVSGRVLYSSFDAPPDALFFVGPDASTLADDTAVGTYYRDASGKVIGYNYKRCDGQTIKIPKIR